LKTGETLFICPDFIGTNEKHIFISVFSVSPWPAIALREGGCGESFFDKYEGRYFYGQSNYNRSGWELRLSCCKNYFKKIVYKYIDDDEMYAFFDSIHIPRKMEGDWSKADPTFPFCSDGMVTFGIAIRKDQMSYCTNDFEMLTGKKPLSIREMFEDIENHRIGGRTEMD
jgi:hypothetical protein